MNPFEDNNGDTVPTDGVIATLCADLDLMTEQNELAKRRVGELEKELDAYKKAKQENDERFMIERDEARSKLAEAVGLLAPVASLGGPDDGTGTPKFHDLEDDVVVYENSGKCLTAGDVRKAAAFVAENGGGHGK